MNEKPTILIVDDDKDLLRQLEFLLEDDFGKILLSTSKNEALELAKEKIDVCLADIRLSKTDADNTDGLELAKALRQKDGSMIIVMMSRYDMGKYETLNHNKYQADAFIRKPFTMDEFIGLLSRIRETKNAGSTAH